MAGRPSESINWDSLGNEADEDASEMNYEYEWVVPDHGSIDDIVIKVEQAFDEYPAERSNRIFLTLQSCMVEVLKQLGGNRYKVPHMRKAVKERLGTSPLHYNALQAL
ncbi:transposase [Hordeum vulgare]|nr:transposase [Hordeum vulgare]